MKSILTVAAVLAALFTFASCQSTTVLLANFNTEAVGAPPAVNQPTGTVAFSDGAGSVRVAASPTGSGSNWLRISHPTQPAPETVMRATFDSFHGTGKYGLLASIFIPSGTGAVTLQLESFNGSIQSAAELLHIDFMPENNIRLNDDNSTRFGSFPRDQAFVVSVQVDNAASPPTATVAVLGAGTSGSKTVNLPAIANQYGAVRFWMGFQWTGTFFVDDILVTKRNM
jgi:hypothetical protein